MPPIRGMPAGALPLPPGESEDDLPLPPRGRNDEDGDSGEEDPYGDRPAGEHKFRFCAKSAFLTYPRCPILPSEYLRYTLINRGNIKHAFGKQERHVDGERHLHVWITFLVKVDTINPRFFDLTIPPTPDHEGQTYHCNIRRGERQRGGGVTNHVRAYDYLCKYDGAVPTQIVGTSELYPTPKNFRKEHGDRTEWLNYLTVRAMPEPSYPIELPDGNIIPTPSAANKQRHIWIYGPPNAGKTKWLEDHVYKFKNYKVSGTTYPFDQYNGEQIIVYDDIVPKIHDLMSITNSSAHTRPVPGSTRYIVRYVPGGKVTLVIVCLNVDIDTIYSTEMPTSVDPIKKRFQQIRLELEDRED